MDFMKLLKSLEELLYEVMVMLVFFPRTLYLTIRHPQRMMDYADTELGDVQSEQYNDTLSPPLFLMICLVLGHLIELALPTSDLDQMPAFLQDDRNLLIFRVFMFSLLPLVLSLRLLAKLGTGFALAAANATGAILTASLLIIATAVVVGFALAKAGAT